MNEDERGGGADAPQDQEQEDFEIDPRTVDASVNADASEFRLDIVKLFTQATEQTRMALCISDPFQDDSPIVYVNEAFVRLTGYERDEVVGRNCRFLQGEDTDPEAVEHIRQAIRDEEVRVIDILNYRKDGTSFWNALHVGPVFDDDGKLQYFYGSQWDVTDILEKRERIRLQDSVAMELKHRTGNLFAAVNAIINLSARGATDVETYRETLNQRIDALHRAHKVSVNDETSKRSHADLRELICLIMEPYQIDRDDRLKFSGEEVGLPREAVTPLGLTVHELATNALKYGSLGSAKGRVDIGWRLRDDLLVIDWHETGSANEPAEDRAGGTGTGTGRRIMQGVLSQLGGTIESAMTPEGLHATITLPHHVPD